VIKEHNKEIDWTLLDT